MFVVLSDKHFSLRLYFCTIKARKSIYFMRGNFILYIERIEQKCLYCVYNFGLKGILTPIFMIIKEYLKVFFLCRNEVKESETETNMARDLWKFLFKCMRFSSSLVAFLKI